MTGVDGVKERVVGASGPHIARRVADHQDVIWHVFAFGRQFQVQRFLTHLLPGDDPHVLGDVVLFPLPRQRLQRRGGDDDHIRLIAQEGQTLAHIRERSHAVHHLRHSRVDGHSPGPRRVQFRVGVRLPVRSQAVVALGKSVSGDKLADARGLWRRDVPRLHLRPLAQQVEHHHQRGPAIDAAPLGIQIDELGRLAGVPGDRLQAPILDDVGDEALFMLDLHRVEGAAIGVDADEKIVLWLKFRQWAGCLGKVCHSHLQ